MNRWLISFMLLVVGMLVFPAVIHAQGTDPAAVVQASVKEFKMGNLEASLAYYADDAVVKLIGVPPGQPDTYKGREQIRAWWKELVAAHFDIQVDVLRVDGDTVTTKTQTWMDQTRQLGVAPLVATEVYVVKNGKITSETWTITPESAAKLQAAIAALPKTGGELFPTYALAVALGGLAILAGLGLRLRRQGA